MLWSLLVVEAAWAAARLAGVAPPWPGSALLAFTRWLLPATLLALVVAALTRHWAALLTAVTIASVLAVVVLPRASGAGEHRRGTALRVMTVNMRVGGAEAAAIVGLVRAHHVDLLALQEYTPQARIALTRAGLDTVLPHRVGDAEPLAIGSALYAGAALTDGRTTLGPGGFTETSATLRMPGATSLRVRSVHPCAPYTRQHQRCWQQGLAHEPHGDRHGPVRLLMGDFNATLDHPQLRHLIGSGYHDAADTVGAGLLPTWPNDMVPVITLDHVLVDPRIGVRNVSVHDVPGTDHRALYAQLTIPHA